MASAPRSSGTDSLDTFRTALSKNMPAPPPSPPAGAVEPDDAEVRELIRDTLLDGLPITIRSLAEDIEVPVSRVIRVLGLPADTSPEQTVVGRTERPARKGRAKS